MLAAPGSGPPATPNVVDEHAWWVVPGVRADVLAYIDAHPPAGSAPRGVGSGGSYGMTGSEFQEFVWPPIANVASTRSLVVEVVQLPGGSTGLRADAQVVWVTPRPASEQIPPGTHRLGVSVGSMIAVNKPRQRPFTVTSAKRIRRIVALLDALPAAQPGVYNCPADFGIYVRLVFHARRGVAPLAVATIDAGGCRGVGLTIGGRPQPGLAGEGLPGTGSSPKASLIQQLDSVLGVKLNTSPPS